MYLRLRFPDEPSARALLARYIDDCGRWIGRDVLVPLGGLSGVDGWHADLITGDPEEIGFLAPYTVLPDSPSHVIAGVG